MWTTIKADARANGLTTPGRAIRSVAGLAPFWLILLHRLAHALHRRRVPIVPNVLRALGMAVWGADLWPAAQLGPGLCIAHTSGIVVGGGVMAGSNLTLFQGATLGGGATLRAAWQSNQPRLGDRVLVSTHAVVAGGIDIGDDVVIGANVVVLEDVASGQTVRAAPIEVRPRASHSSD
jgi:serine O-acetyltransferase